MPITDDAFTRWLDTIGASTRTADLAQLIQQPVSRVRAQRLRSRISLGTVVAVCRVLGLDPLEHLGSFPGLGLLATASTPEPREALSQLQIEDVMLEVARRRRADIAASLAGYPLQHFPFPDSTRFWINAIDHDGGLRRHVSQVTDTDFSTLSRAITNNNLTAAQAVAAASYAGLASAAGLVFSGLLSPSEARWRRYERENALLECADTDLLNLLDVRMSTLRRAVEAREAEKTYWNAMG